MHSIHCLRCHRDYFSAASGRGDMRCPVCRGPLEDGLGPVARWSPMPLGTPPPPRAETGSYEAGPFSYRSLGDYSAADERRGVSKEVDL